MGIAEIEENWRELVFSEYWNKNDWKNVMSNGIISLDIMLDNFALKIALLLSCVY